MAAPITKFVEVPLSQEEAYELFTQKMGQWWPLETRSITAHQQGTRALGLSCAPCAGGEIAEIAPDGTRHIWGHYVDCDAPYSVEIQFHMGQPKEHATLLVVSFRPASDGRSIVKLLHTGWESYGEVADMMRDGYDAAWDEIFQSCFVAACRPKS